MNNTSYTDAYSTIATACFAVALGMACGALLIGPMLENRQAINQKQMTYDPQVDSTGFEQNQDYTIIQVDHPNPQGFIEFPAAILQNPAIQNQLQRLVVRYGRVSMLPDEISLLSSLTSLIFTNNALYELPLGVGALSRLEVLNLSGNNITGLPHSMDSLLNLEKLILSDNELAALPESLKSLQKLRVLDLKNNNISTLQVDHLPGQSLEILYLGGNNLPVIQIQAIQSALPKTRIYY